MNDPNERYYDLSRPGSLSRGLLSKKRTSTPPQTRGVLAPDNTVVFRVPSRHRGGEGALPAPPRAAEQTFSIAGIDDWQDFAHRAKQYADARKVCVVDEHGLVVAAAGDDSQSYAEKVGARVLVALDQARKVDQRAGRWVRFELTDGVITGLRAPQQHSPLTLIVDSKEELHHDRVKQLCAAVEMFAGKEN